MSDVIFIEVTYPHWMGGEMLDAYQATDQEMAQSTINIACESAALLERDRIIELLDTTYEFSNAIFDAEFKLPDGNDVLEVNHAIRAFNAYRAHLLALIKGEQK